MDGCGSILTVLHQSTTCAISTIRALSNLLPSRVAELNCGLLYIIRQRYDIPGQKQEPVIKCDILWINYWLADCVISQHKIILIIIITTYNKCRCIIDCVLRIALQVRGSLISLILSNPT